MSPRLTQIFILCSCLQCGINFKFLTIKLTPLIMLSCTKEFPIQIDSRKIGCGTNFFFFLHSKNRCINNRSVLAILTKPNRYKGRICQTQLKNQHRSWEPCRETFLRHFLLQSDRPLIKMSVKILLHTS